MILWCLKKTSNVQNELGLNELGHSKVYTEYQVFAYTKYKRNQVEHDYLLPSQHTVSGHHRLISETPFKWRFAGGLMLAYFSMFTGAVCESICTYVQVPVFISTCLPFYM